MSEWINVKDKLPELYETVLVYTKDSINIVKRTDPKDGNIWDVIAKECITHWMHLPSTDSIKDFKND